MKIGRRNFSSFADFMDQFQQFAIHNPWKATADAVIVSLIIIGVSLLF